MPILSLNYPSVIGFPTGKLAGRTTAGAGSLESIAPDATLNLSAGGIGLNLGNANTWTVSQNFSAGISLASDTILTRKAAATLQLGAADAASPVAQTVSAQSVVTGTLNTAGQNWTFNASQGTGTGAGGSIVFQTAPAGLTGTAQNALVNALTLDSTNKLTIFGTGGTKSLSLFNDNSNSHVRSNASGELYIESATNIRLLSTGAASVIVRNSTDTKNLFSVSSTGDVVVGAALATTATDGFLYIPTCPGVPTGTPTTQTGTVPIVYDTADNKIYIFNSVWKAVALA